MRKISLGLLASVIILAVIFTFSMASCGKETVEESAKEEVVEETTEEEVAEEEAEEAEEEIIEKEPVTLTIAVLNVGAWQSLAANITSAFEEIVGAEGAHITLDYEAISYMELHDKVALNENSGTGAYDIYFLNTDWLPEFIPAGYLEPLNSYIEEKPIEGWPDVWPEALLQCQTVDGEFYGPPAHDGPYMLFYRTDLFEDQTEKDNFKAEYGYELAPPETWAQFKDIADFFTRGDELYGTCFAGNDPQATPYDLVQIAHNFGGEYFDSSGAPIFNSDIWVDALEFLGSMYRENSPEGAASLDMMGRGNLFREGKIALYMDWTGLATYFKDPELSNIIGKVGYGLAPKGGENGNNDSLSIYWVWAMSATSKNKEDAWQAMLAMTTPEVDKAWTMDGGGGNGCRLSTMTDPEVIADHEYYPTEMAILETGGFSSPFTPAAGQIYDILRIAVQDYLAGNGTAQEVLDDANDKIVEAIAAYEE